MGKCWTGLLAFVVAVGGAYAWFDQHSDSLCRRIELGHIWFLCESKKPEVAGQAVSPAALDSSKGRTPAEQSKESGNIDQNTNQPKVKPVLPVGNFQFLVGQTKAIIPGTRILVQEIGGTGTNLKADIATDSVQGLTSVRVGDVLSLPSDLGDIVVTVVRVAGQSVTFTVKQVP